MVGEPRSGDHLELHRISEPERIKNAESNVGSPPRGVTGFAPRRRNRVLKEVEEIPSA